LSSDAPNSNSEAAGKSLGMMTLATGLLLMAMAAVGATLMVAGVVLFVLWRRMEAEPDGIERALPG
jgi:hypothetical protein